MREARKALEDKDRTDAEGSGKKEGIDRIEKSAHRLAIWGRETLIMKFY
ncbi:hypothetical protein OH492_27280 [Vibrio chagasii]|nr:hypothetical protein [Vibrio chagasii]